MANKLGSHKGCVFRAHWLCKGLNTVRAFPNLFNDKLSMVDELGMGLTGAESLKYWLITAGLIQKTKSGYELTEIGQLIYDKDKYLEDLMTPIILHSIIAANKDATTINYFFNKFNLTEFTKEDFINRYREALLYEKDENGKIINYHSYNEKVLDKEFSILFHSYYDDRNVFDPEDTNYCIFKDLGFIGVENKTFYKRNNVINLKKVDDYIIYALIMRNHYGEDSFSLDNLLYEDNGLCKTLNITYGHTLLNLLYRLANKGFVRLELTAGLNMIYVLKKMSFIECIKAYYDEEEQKGRYYV